MGRSNLRAIGMSVAVFTLISFTEGRAQVVGWRGVVDTDWNNPANWVAGTVPPTGGGPFSVCIFVTNQVGFPLYYTAAQGSTIYNNGTGVGSQRPLRIAADGTSPTGALYITGGVLESRGSAGDVIGNLANSFGTLAVDGGVYIHTNQMLLFGNSGARAVFTVNSGTALVATIQGVNTATGEINVTGGRLIFDRITTNGTIRLNLFVNGGTLQSRSAQSSWMPGNVNVQLGSAGAVISTLGGSVSLGAPISGTGGLVKTNDNTLTLSGTNSYEGVTIVAGGTLVVGNNSALGSTAQGTEVRSGAILQLANGVAVTGETVRIIGNGDNYGALQAAGGGTSVWNGAVLLDSNAGSWAPRLGAQANGALVIAGPIMNGAAGQHAYFSGHGTTGRVILSTNSSYTGITGIIRGIVQLGVDDALPTGTRLILNVAGIGTDASIFNLAGFNQTVAALGNASTAQPCVITNSTATLSTLTVNQSATNTAYSGTIAGAVSLVKSGSAMLVLSNQTTHTGATLLQNGTLVIVPANGLSASAASVANGTLLLGTTNAVPAGLSFVGASPSAALGPTYTLDQPFLDWAGSAVAGTVPVIVSPSNFTSSLTFTGGLAQTFLGAWGSVTNTGGAAWADGTLRLGGGAGTLVYAAVISGPTNVAIGPVGGNPASVVVLLSNNTHTGTTTIRSGTLRIDSDANLGAVPAGPVANALVINGGTLLGPAADITLHTRRGIQIGAEGAAIGAPGGGILRIGALVSDVPGEAGVLLTTGTGILVLSGTNTYSGGTWVMPGSSLVIMGDRAVGDGPLVLTGGLMRAAATAAATTYVSNNVVLAANSTVGGANNKSLVFLGPITIAHGTRTVTAATGNDLTYFDGPIGDGGNGYGLTKAGTGTVILRGTNTFTGPLRVTAGTLRLAGQGSVASSLIEISAGATLDVTTRSSGDLTLASGQTLRGSGTFAGGLIVGSGATLAPGLSPGILTVNGNVTMSSGSVFEVELNGLTAGTQYDQLNMNGNMLALVSPTLQVVLGFTPALNNTFTIVTGLSGFDPVWNGTFAGLPNASTFTVGTTEFRIDYNTSDITLTVVPEPHTLSLLGLVAGAWLLRRRIR